MPRDRRCMRARAHLRPCVRAQTGLDVSEDLLDPAEALVELVNLLLAKEIIRPRSTTNSSPAWKVKAQQGEASLFVGDQDAFPRLPRFLARSCRAAYNLGRATVGTRRALVAANLRWLVSWSHHMGTSIV